MSKRVTIADVAREAGVSMMTVSRVLNRKGEISESTYVKVQQVIDRLGYRPSGIARGLASNKTRTLGLVVPDVGNPFFSDFARGAEHQAYRVGYNVFLCNTDEDPRREQVALDSLEEKRVDGLLLCSSRLDDETLALFIERFPAAALFNRRLPASQAVSFMLDDEYGGGLAAEHLLRSGHHAIGYLSGPAASQSGARRVRGYQDAMSAAGYPIRPGWIAPCPPNVEGAQQVAREFLATRPELSGLLCYNDLVAVGVLQACRDLGRRVPDDLAVIGYDDIPLAGLVSPALTTCRLPRYDMGAQAMDLLIHLVENPQEPQAQKVIRPELVVRQSAPAPKSRPSKESRPHAR